MHKVSDEMKFEDEHKVPIELIIEEVTAPNTMRLLQRHMA